MKYWKVRFLDTIDGFGWLEFDDNLVAGKLYTDNGKQVTKGVSYQPCVNGANYDLTPDWVK